MKNKIFTVLLIITLSSCIDDVLDRKPLNLVSDSDVWKSEELAVVYLAALYDAIPIGFDRSGYTYEANLTDEASHPYAGNTIVNNYGNHGLTLNTGMYAWVRRANYFISKIGESALSEDVSTALAAECRFIRAYYYFDLVKKYGGMPIITEVQKFEDNLEQLKVPRNTEDEVYDFILSELDLAISDLPDERDAKNNNRATKSVALALKSRSMLYAGTIAKYGSIQLNGLLGVPADKANLYLSESLDASNLIVASGRFTLYSDYEKIFTEEGNNEVIFQKAYSNPDKRHNYDGYNMPESYKPGCCGNSSAPTLEMVESYEYVDGSDGKLDYENKEFDSPADLFLNKDPRFEATILYSGSPFGGRPVQIYRGIYDEDGTLYEIRNTPFPKDPSVMQVGRDGPYTLGDIGKTGFYIKKYMNTGAVVPENQSDQNYIDFRYAEILLNQAEAAFESGDRSTALEAVNKVRERAGIKLLIDAELTLDRIRNERKVELAFEDKRFWDIRRWRIGTSLFQNTYIHGLWPYLKYTAGEFKYIFKAISGHPIDNGQVRIFNERDYYSNLAGYISSNENIVNNPGW